MNLILTTTLSEKPIDAEHCFMCIGPNCWGRGNTAKEAYQNARANAPHGYRGLFITRVAPLAGLGVDPVNGAISWSETHDARNCKLCSVGKGIRINIDKTFKEE